MSLQQGGISCVWSEDNHIQVPHAAAASAAAAEVPLSQNPYRSDPWPRPAEGEREHTHPAVWEKKK